MFVGFSVCIAFFLFGLLNALGFQVSSLVAQLRPATERVALQPVQPWGTARAVKASASSLISIVAFFFAISSM